MTVLEPYLNATEDLASYSRYFPATINVPHHQLRNFISTVYENKLYFVHEFDIFVLDLQRNQRSLVVTVPFEARCLAAAHGWVCVGGETKGDCAFVHVEENDEKGGDDSVDLVVDMLGEEIVNSMTIHRISGAKDGQQGEIVVLISNNDKTVTVYSLSQQEVLAVLRHPVPMNYAMLSPDSKLLAAVGDSNQVWFYRREDQPVNGTKTGVAEQNWQLIALPDMPADNGIYDDYSFAVSFSPSGHLCAVSAQGGWISIFDMQVLQDDPKDASDAIVATFRSSRNSLWGCVRSLSFSPAPWDLLAWTEDHGRVGIADVRRRISRRQIVQLKADPAMTVHLENITPSEVSCLDVKERLKHQHQQRMRALRGYPPVGARLRRDLAGRQPEGEVTTPQASIDLDERERSVLDALETTIEDVNQQSLRPYSINYASDRDARHSTLTAERQQRYDVQLLNPRAANYPPPRRRRSIMLSDPTADQSPNLHVSESNRAMMTASPAPMSENTSTTPSISTNDLRHSQNPSPNLPMPYNIPESDPWHIIEATLATDQVASRTRALDTNHRLTLRQLETAIFEERQVSNRLERQLADERRLSALLRTELETRERLLEMRQQQFHDQQSERRPSPSLERILQRQLQSEQENGRQRSHELETELRNNTDRIERFVGQRASLIMGLSIPDESNGPSARSTALPTVLINRTAGTELQARLDLMEGERSIRRQRLYDLESQMRRAESSVELASVQNSIERVEAGNRYHERALDARFLSAARARPSGTLRSLAAASLDANNTNTNASNRERVRGAAIRRAEVAMNADRSTLPRDAEVTHRVSESDRRLARIMMQSASVDGNGNWVVNNGPRRTSTVLNTISNATTNMSSAIGVAMNSVPVTPTRASAVEVMMSDAGVGTAGLGWSPDGRFIYVGTEQGIFELKTNIRDRMYFPACEMR